MYHLLCFYIRTYPCNCFKKKSFQSDSWASLPASSPLQYWSPGTYLLLLTELLPSMFQHMLITHGVALKVAAFSGHHITTQGKEAGLEVVFLESDLKRKGIIHSSSSRAASSCQGSWHMFPRLTDPLPLLLHRKMSALSLRASLLGLPSTFAGPGTSVQMEAHILYV